MSDPITLAVDAAGRTASLCLSVPPAETELATLDSAGRRNGRVLIPEAVALCDRHGLRLADVELVCVTLGPGSFTGLRLAVTFAKALAFAAGCDAVGVPSHAAVRQFAETLSPSGTVINVVSDALREHLYVTRFVLMGENEPAEAGPTRLVSLAEYVPDGSVLCDDERLRGRMPGIPFSPAEGAVVDAETLLAVGLERWRTGVRDDPFALVPLYVRRSSAEEKAAVSQAGRMRPA